MNHATKPNKTAWLALLPLALLTACAAPLKPPPPAIAPTLNARPSAQPLPSEALQTPVARLPALCLNGCVVGLNQRAIQWSQELLSVTDDDLVRLLGSQLEASHNNSIELAEELQRARNAGNTCTDLYINESAR